MIQVNDKYFEPYLDELQISEQVKFLSHAISNDYKGKDVVFLVILNGAFMFASDLLKKVDLPCQVSFIKVSSYHGTKSTGRVDEIIGLTASLYGKHVVIIEDIVDTGITVDKVKKLLEAESPESVKVCTLLYKPDAFQGNHTPEYVGFSIPNDFVVGYGLDYNEKGRNIPSIFKIKED